MAGDPVDTQVRVRFSSWKVSSVMEGGSVAGERENDIMIRCYIDRKSFSILAITKPVPVLLMCPPYTTHP